MDLMSIKSIAELGFAISVASYLIWFITSKVMKSQDKILTVLEKMFDYMKEHK